MLTSGHPCSHHLSSSSYVSHFFVLCLGALLHIAHGLSLDIKANTRVSLGESTLLLPPGVDARCFLIDIACHVAIHRCVYHVSHHLNSISLLCILKAPSVLFSKFSAACSTQAQLDWHSRLLSSPLLRAVTMLIYANFPCCWLFIKHVLSSFILCTSCRCLCLTSAHLTSCSHSIRSVISR